MPQDVWQFIKTLAKHYRKGAVGVMMDEYERAILEFKSMLQPLSDEEFIRIRDLETTKIAARSKRSPATSSSPAFITQEIFEKYLVLR